MPVPSFITFTPVIAHHHISIELRESREFAFLLFMLDVQFALKADYFATTLASLSAELANANQVHASRTSSDPLVSAPSLPPLVAASHSSCDPPKPSAPALLEKHVLLDTITQIVASVNAPRAVASPVPHLL